MNIHSIRFRSSLPSIVLGFTIFLTIGVFSHLLSLQEKALDNQSNRFLKAISAVLNADRDLYQAHVAEINIVAGNGTFQKEDESRKENAQQVLDRFHLYIDYLNDYPEITSQFSGFDETFHNWFNASNTLVQARQATSDINLLKEQTGKSFSTLRDVLDKAGELAEAKSQQLQLELEENISTFKATALLVIIIIIAIASWFSYYMPKTLTAQIDYMIQRLSEIASGDGDLTARLEINSKDEFKSLADEFNRFVDNLQELITAILSQSTELETLTHSLADSSEQNKSITSTLNTTSDSIVNAVNGMNSANKEMTSIADHSSEEASNASDMAGKGITVVYDANDRIKELSNNMDKALDRSIDLQKRSEDISSVLDVIRNVAEQTNLLALNAAIEAARAGEQGRGFAVVADEVRTLATRTQDSTNDIQSIIEQLKTSVKESATAIDAGKKNVDNTISIFTEANDVFHSLKGSASNVCEMSQQTAHATKNQMSVSDEISKNVSELSEQTASVSQVAETSEQLACQIQKLADNLNTLVCRFKV